MNTNHELAAQQWWRNSFQLNPGSMQHHFHFRGPYPFPRVLSPPLVLHVSLLLPIGMLGAVQQSVGVFTGTSEGHRCVNVKERKWNPVAGV